VLGSIFFAAQQPAPLAWDAPNRLLTWGWAPTHIWKIQLSYFFEYRTGYPYSIVNLQQQLVGAPNSSRFPDYKNLNLALEKKFAFRGICGRARRDGERLQFEKSQRSGEQYRRAEFRCIVRRPAPSLHRARPFRGKKIDQELMHLAIDHALKAKCPKTALGCVSAQVERHPRPLP